MLSPFVEVEGLHYQYGHGETTIEALRGVDLVVERGEYVAIVGLNGSGKSTLARCISGLLLPSAGHVHVNGLSTHDPSARVAIRATVGMVFQDPDNQFVMGTVEDEVAFGPENMGIPSGEIRQRVDMALARVGLAGLNERDPHTLSAGEKARLAVASLLAMQPWCLVLDELTAMLDPISRASMLGLLGGLHAEGMTVVVVTHHMSEVALAERVIVLQEGQVALEGSPPEVFQSEEQLRALGLALPPAAAIAHGLARRGLDVPQTIVCPEDLVTRLAMLARVAR